MILTKSLDQRFVDLEKIWIWSSLGLLGLTVCLCVCILRKFGPWSTSIVCYYKCLHDPFLACLHPIENHGPHVQIADIFCWCILDFPSLSSDDLSCQCLRDDTCVGAEIFKIIPVLKIVRLLSAFNVSMCLQWGIPAIQDYTADSSTLRLFKI